ncbi:MAG: BatD family protein [Rickettsiales bacterium]
MVKKILIIILSLLIFSLKTQAQTFEASTNKTNFSKGEEIILTLTLSDLDTNKVPDISPLLKTGFILKRKNYSSKTSYINGKYTKNMSWIYYLTTKLTGNITIPEISIETEQRTLKTTKKNINIDVNSEVISHAQDKIKLTHILETETPYVNQTIILKAKITRLVNSYNNEFILPESEDALIELITEPKSYRDLINNQEAIITEYNFSVTPIKAGKIKISSAKYKGKILSNNNNSYNNINNIFGFTDFNEYEDFFISNNDIVLNVKDRADPSKEWLPLKSYKITTKLPDLNKTIYPGDPIEFSIIIDAYNAKKAQIPDLIFNQTDQYKIYRDQAEIEENFELDKFELQTKKIEKFTIVPLVAGEINLKNIEINWFDVKNHKFVTEKSRPFTINVTAKAHNIATQADYHNNNYNSENNITNSKSNILLYSTIILAITNLILISLIIYLIIKIKYPAKKTIASAANHKISLKKLNQLNNIKEINLFLLQYFRDNYQLNAHNLKNLEIMIKENLKVENNFSEIFANINAAIYAKRELDLNKLKQRLNKFLTGITKNKKKSINEDELKLNP